MRLALAVALASTLAVAAPPQRKPVIALLPATSSSGELQQLGLLIEARASELLEQSDRYSELHLKQVLSMAEQESLTAEAMAEVKRSDAARLALGADRVVSVSVEPKDKGLLLSGVISDGKRATPFTASLPAAWPQALKDGSDAIARAMLKLDGAALPKGAAEPESKSEEALKALGACAAVVLKQPLGIENPAVLEGNELEGAIAQCIKADAADATLHYAAANLALARAINGDDAAATRDLAGLSEKDGATEAFTLARFWLLTRYQSNEAGVAFLESVTRAHPGELIARDYLAETLGLVGEFGKALAAWDAYLALAPASPFAHGQRSRALARLGRYDEAISAAKKAVELNPAGRDARLQLGSRYVDAAKYDLAIATLAPLVALPDARGEHALRLGWAYWLKGDADAAARYFKQALDLATRPAEWRTRGRAFYDLALVEAKRGNKDASRVALRAAVQTGYKAKQVDPVLAEAARDVERVQSGRQPVDSGGPAPRALLPRESSLFPLDPYGDLDPNAKKPPPPEGLILFRF